MLTYISKKIIQSRLLDKGIIIDISDLDNILIDNNSFTNLNSMYDCIVSNWNKLIIN